MPILPPIATNPKRIAFPGRDAIVQGMAMQPVQDHSSNAHRRSRYLNLFRYASFIQADPENQMQCRFFLNIVIRQRTTILQLLACKYKLLLIRWDIFLILNFLFYILNAIGPINIECNRFSRQGFDKDLHARISLGC